MGAKLGSNGQQPQTISLVVRESIRVTNAMMAADVAPTDGGANRSTATPQGFNISSVPTTVEGVG